MQYTGKNLDFTFFKEMNMFKILLLIMILSIVLFAKGMLKDKYFVDARVYFSDMRTNKIENLNQRDKVLEKWINLQLKEYGMLSNDKTPKSAIVSTLEIETEVFGNSENTLYSVKIKAYNQLGNDISLYPIVLFWEDINYGLLNGGDLGEETKNFFKIFLKDWVSQNSN